MRRVRCRDPLPELSLRVGKRRFIREIFPLQWIGVDIVQFLPTVAVADVMKIA